MGLRSRRMEVFGVCNNDRGEGFEVSMQIVETDAGYDINLNESKSAATACARSKGTTGSTAPGWPSPGSRWRSRNRNREPQPLRPASDIESRSTAASFAATCAGRSCSRPRACSVMWSIVFSRGCFRSWNHKHFVRRWSEKWITGRVENMAVVKSILLLNRAGSKTLLGTEMSNSVAGDNKPNVAV